MAFSSLLLSSLEFLEVSDDNVLLPFPSEENEKITTIANSVALVLSCEYLHPILNYNEQ